MQKKPKILGIIPARAGSRAIPSKNIKLLAGKPLIDYTIQSALQSKLLDTILVSTDCTEIIKFIKLYPKIEAPFVRPWQLALDTTPTLEVVQHAIDYYAGLGEIFDFVCLLQPTSPFRRMNLIDNSIRRLIESGADSLTTVRKVPDRHNPHWTFKMEANRLVVSTGDEQIIPRRQELPDAWYRDGKVYISSVDLILKGNLLGGRLIGFENNEEPDVNIDNWEDWKLAKKLLQNGFTP